MNLDDNKTSIYIDRIEEFLQTLRDEISALTREPDKKSVDNLDYYIHEINSFYYRSFNERFFPIYKNAVQEDISKLLKLGRQEEMIKRDILANIKRYAGLYNQVKRVSSLLSQTREECNISLLAVSRDRDKRSTELLYALKNLYESLATLLNLTHQLEILSKDTELIGAIRRYPAHSSALQLICSLEMNDPLIKDACNRLLVHLQYNKKLLVKLQHNKPDNKQLAAQIINDIKDNTVNFVKEKAPSAIQSFYIDNLQNQFLMYTELISLHIETNNISRINQMAGDFEKWLDNLLTVLGKGINYMTKEQGILLDSIPLISKLSPTYIEKLYKDINKITESVRKIVDDLAQTGEPDFAFFSQTSRRMLDTAIPWLNTLTKQKEVASISILDSTLYRVNLEMAFLALKLDLLDEKQKHSTQVMNNFLSITNMLDSYLNLLANIRADLERLLAPRNIARTYKDMLVRVERIPLEKGQVFPPEYHYLLDKYSVEIRLAEQPDNTILYEEGDIFIIRVDDLLEEEFPYIIVTQKG